MQELHFRLVTGDTCFLLFTYWIMYAKFRIWFQKHRWQNIDSVSSYCLWEQLSSAEQFNRPRDGFPLAEADFCLCYVSVPPTCPSSSAKVRSVHSTGLIVVLYCCDFKGNEMNLNEFDKYLHSHSSFLNICFSCYFVVLESLTRNIKHVTFLEAEKISWFISFLIFR